MSRRKYEVYGGDKQSRLEDMIKMRKVEAKHKALEKAKGKTNEQRVNAYMLRRGHKGRNSF